MTETRFAFSCSQSSTHHHCANVGKKGGKIRYKFQVSSPKWKSIYHLKREATTSRHKVVTPYSLVTLQHYKPVEHSTSNMPELPETEVILHQAKEENSWKYDLRPSNRTEGYNSNRHILPGLGILDLRFATSHEMARVSCSPVRKGRKLATFWPSWG